MLRALNNTPIFRRLFIAFAIATVIPGVVIASLGVYYLNSLTIRGQAVKNGFDAQNTAFEEQINLSRMNALLNTRFSEVFASRAQVLNGAQLTGPQANQNLTNNDCVAAAGIPRCYIALDATGQLTNNEIFARELEFDKTVRRYQQDFQVATSDNMSVVRMILLNDDPNNSNLIALQQTALTRVIDTEWVKYKQKQDQVIAALGNNASLFNASYTPLYEANQAFLILKNDWQNLVSIAEQMGTTVTKVGGTQTQPVIMSTALAFFFTILVILVIGYIVNVTITNPLRSLASLTGRIVRGDTTARARIEGRDEISVVAASMNNMLDKIVDLVQQAESRHAMLQSQIEKLLGEVSGVGEGDLRVQAEVTADDLGVLADSFNYMVEELSNLVVRVKLLSREVETATMVAFERMAQLVRSADTQIGRINAASNEVNGMADLSRQVAEHAQVLFNSAYDARQVAQGGRIAVQQTVEGMGRIHQNVQVSAAYVQSLGEHSREITDVVEVISSIAHQTNRLALDAAIQAAMAGEHGTGFGAVAADIRRLAERVKEQVAMISRIVRSVLEDIKAAALSMSDTEYEASVGTKLAGEAGSALESIYAVVERQAVEIEKINQMVARQMQVSGPVVQLMNEVSEVTQQGTSTTHETSRQMEQLARIAAQLLASVEAFKLREDQGYPRQSSPRFAPIQQPVPTLSVQADQRYRNEWQSGSNGFSSGTYMPAPTLAKGQWYGNE